MTHLDDYYGFRDVLVEKLHLDLIGPAEGDDEIIETAEGTLEAPLDRYVMGTLWPNAEDNKSEAPDVPDGIAGNDSETVVDSPVPQSLVRNPTSVGLTFAVDLAVESSFTIRPHAARYMPEGLAEHRARTRARQQEYQSWRRDVPPMEVRQFDAHSTGVTKIEATPGLQLYVFIRPPRGGVATVTVALQNVQWAKAGERDAAAWFQVSIEVSASAACFVDRTPVLPKQSSDPDLRSGALLYRHVRNFATGHGCAVQWDTAELSRHTSHLSTTFLPTSELRRAQAVGNILGMKFLAEASDDDIARALTAMVAAYRTWIAERAEEADALYGSVRETAQLHVAEANKAADRMAAGITMLQHDARALQAFRLSNQAMYLQRNRQDWIRAGAEGVPTFDDQSWRPFQIAFVLINLPALADRSHPDRELADLLWFPTGGGKTEAYLGLIAFTIFHRRLLDRNASGVAVIMRYTLRLLTIQQFERAAMLLCSLETIRHRDTAVLGDRPFSIGLWVGRASTPNTLQETTTALNALRRGDTLEEGNPAQLTRCPWCNQHLEPGRHYRVAKTPSPRLLIACGNRTCDFAQGLPVHVVDEDVYGARPELLIGTVDKFARMAWDDKVGGLFAADGSGSKPDLIIQDELHLIAGPLGSVVGLYEVAVDVACEDRSTEPPTRAKIIASTATIRRAEAQVRAVFDRGVAQFPPPGLEPDNSFFAAVAERDVLGTRLYLGAMAPGTSHTTLMIRIYAALLHYAQAVPGSDTVRDTYWTLMGYFNSLRVLGSAFLQVSDDVGTRLALLSRRDGVPVRKVGEPSELTSRVPSSEIPARLKSLEAGLGNAGDDEVQDVVLATNMISVGLDVDRLGLMAVMGQPQSSAEYIQATSRVGRKFPALVVAIYNSARSRDRSHYESFLPFHEALYRAVESVSATPYAARARDRALHGALVSAVRLTIEGMSSNGGAARIDDELDAIHDLTDRIVERIARADSSESQAAAEQLEGFLIEWLDAAADTPDLKYSVRKQREGVLIRDASDAIGEDTVSGGAPVPWPTLQSMRDVDAESTVFPISKGNR